MRNRPWKIPDRKDFPDIDDKWRQTLKMCALPHSYRSWKNLERFTVDLWYYTSKDHTHTLNNRLIVWQRIKVSLLWNFREKTHMQHTDKKLILVWTLTASFALSSWPLTSWPLHLMLWTLSSRSLTSWPLTSYPLRRPLSAPLLLSTSMLRPDPDVDTGLYYVHISRTFLYGQLAVGFILVLGFGCYFSSSWWNKKRPLELVLVFWKKHWKTIGGILFAFMVFIQSSPGWITINFQSSLTTLHDGDINSNLIKNSTNEFVILSMPICTWATDIGREAIGLSKTSGILGIWIGCISFSISLPPLAKLKRKGVHFLLNCGPQKVLKNA